MYSMGLHRSLISFCSGIGKCRAPLGSMHTIPMGRSPSTCSAMQQKTRDTLKETPNDSSTSYRTPQIDGNCIMRGNDVGPADVHGQMEHGSKVAEGAWQGQYPRLMEAYPGFCKVHVEPPVYIIRDFLTGAPTSHHPIPLWMS
jgi:hypothetical protein